MTDKGYIAGGAEEFRYEAAPLGQKVLLLTSTGTCVVGTWYGAYGEYFWGWAPLPKRNKQAEQQLGLRWVCTN